MQYPGQPGCTHYHLLAGADFNDVSVSGTFSSLTAISGNWTFTLGGDTSGSISGTWTANKN